MKIRKKSVYILMTLFLFGCLTCCDSVNNTEDSDDTFAADDVVWSVFKDTTTDIPLSTTPAKPDLTFLIDTEPSYGSVSISGMIAAYTPDSNYLGNDSFTYKAFNGVQYSNTATVTVSVGYAVYSDTGQTDCFDNSGVIDCPSEGEEFYGQDAQFSGIAPSYSDNGDGTITDNVTGLMWQQTDDNKKTDNFSAWVDTDYFDLAGYSDWRLPRIDELFNLLHFGREDPLIESNVFLNTKSDYYLSDTPAFTVPYSTYDYYKILDFGDAFMSAAEAEETIGYARYVRGEYQARTAYTINGDGTIFEHATNLTWQEEENPEEKIWKDALRYCSELSLAEKSDWRLPNAKELQNFSNYPVDIDWLLDYYDYWSSTSNSSGDKAYQGNTVYNEFNFLNKMFLRSVICVRGGNSTEVLNR